MNRLLVPFLVLSAVFLQSPSQAGSSPTSSPVEIGTVDWQRDLPKALEASRKEQRPVLVLFQEVPGCAGCQKFGKEVLSDPLMVSCIESSFVPVLVYNNRAGTDAEILKQYREPAWNYPVVRFLDAFGTDLIERKDQVFTRSALADRMAQALEKGKHPVPAALTGMAYEPGGRPVKETLFAQSCFWTGERTLGAVDGVVRTEAGFVGGREVTRVWYDPVRLPLPSLVDQAFKTGCADAVLVPSENDRAALAQSPASSRVSVFQPATYRKAPASDQKKQLQGTDYQQKGSTDYQRTKLNAFARTNPARADAFDDPAEKETPSR